MGVQNLDHLKGIYHIGNFSANETIASISLLMMCDWEPVSDFVNIAMN
jgi:hypothetical protein